LVIEGKVPGGGGEVEMDVTFQVPSERVDGQQDAGQEALLGGELLDDVNGKGREGIQEMAITRFAGMRGLHASATGGADKDMPTGESRSTDEPFEHIDKNRFADEAPMGQKEPPPIAVVEEDIPEVDGSADEFHSGKLYPLAPAESKSCCPLRAA
jgi:hypothetical protein